MRKICVVTGTRAEYGLLSNLMKQIKADDDFELQIIATGMHLSPQFGNTYKEIEKDGFLITRKIELFRNSDSVDGVASSIGIGIKKLSEVFVELCPDIIVLLGDRYEILSAAIAAMVHCIPVAHIHGGETTEGAFDEAIRHSVTKMSHLHFASCGQYRKRIIQLGEDPQRVFNVGALGVENIKNIKLLNKEEFENSIDFALDSKNLLITFHPVTLEKNSSEKQFKELLEAILELDNTNFIFTKPNSDPDNVVISDMIDEFVSKNKDKAVAFVSMGQLRYLSAMQFVDAVVGNSSSGIIEAPSFNIGTINIGDRQKGRIQADSVINCEPVKESINKAFEKLYSAEFQNILKSVKNPYEQENSSAKIKSILKSFDLNNILKKSFYNINF